MNKIKKTVIIGASTDPARYSYKAAAMLNAHDVPFVPVGIKKGELFGQDILNGQPTIDEVDTVTLYVGPQNQEAWADYIVSLKPRRVIFNPGTENQDLKNKVEQSGAEAVEACTLVLLSTGQY
jgi:predicted CoA-binding protein